MKWRSGAFALAAVFSLTHVVAAGQTAPQATVDELVAKNIEAKGGAARLKALTTVKQTSTQVMQGQTIAVTTYAKRPNWTRTELNVGGKMVINGFDGVVAWIVNPLAGLTTPVLVSGPQADMIREQPGIVGALVDYKGQGYTIAVEGMEESGDRNLIHLRLTRKKQVSHVYLDAMTFLEAKIANESDQFKLEQEFSDYRDVDGVKWPFQIRMLANGVMQSEIKVLTVEFNTPIDDATFRVPKGS